jgi:23S rRNA (cytosine1962-C5)-methyltransferase
MEKVNMSTEAFENRLRKNFAKFKKWAERNDLEAYRLYDRDMPEFAFAVDIYLDVVVLQYFDRRSQPKIYSLEADEVKAQAEISSGLEAVGRVLGVPQDKIFLKRRKKREDGSQYEKLHSRAVTRVVREQGLRFLVNVSDYLDTGLFLDHRVTRSLVRSMSSGKRVLNLFAYTGSISVYANAGGASEVVTVDMSNTYLDWARENFTLNGMSAEGNPLVRADVLRYLEEQKETNSFFDLIVVDPPSFSNSKKMSGVFDVQEHHVGLLKSCEDILKPGGKILFSNNLRSFKLCPEISREWRLEDISEKTIPEDFRNEKIHKAWILCP